jgi:hypothetical protein
VFLTKAGINQTWYWNTSRTPPLLLPFLGNIAWNWPQPTMRIKKIISDCCIWLPSTGIPSIQRWFRALI